MNWKQTGYVIVGVIILTLIAALGVALPAGPPAGQIPPALAGPAAPVPAGQLVQLSLTGLTLEQAKRSQVVHYPRDGVTLFPAATWQGTPVIFFTATHPARYLVVICYPAADGSVAKIESELDVKGGPQPNPPLPPEPPAPGEKIAPGKLWLIVILPDLTRQTPSQAKILASPQLHKLLDAKGNHFRWVDAKTAPPDIAPYLAVADGLPRALVASAEAAAVAKAKTVKDLVRESAPLTDEAAVVALLKKWGGE
jgi:hypothetical protein